MYLHNNFFSLFKICSFDQKKLGLAKKVEKCLPKKVEKFYVRYIFGSIFDF